MAEAKRKKQEADRRRAEVSNTLSTRYARAQNGMPLVFRPKPRFQASARKKKNTRQPLIDRHGLPS